MESLEDIIDYGLKILFIGYNPGLRTAETGHHYAGRSNAFWKILFESGLIPVPFSFKEDRRLLDFGYGSTNIVGRPTKGADQLRPDEYREGAILLRSKLEVYKPRVACYVGIGVYKKFSGRTSVSYGLQAKSQVEGVFDYVCSSTSGLNRMPYYQQLQHFKILRELLESMPE